ncbi:hypothetical protein [Polyangium sorediatum]|uniref:XRE family transcriptional regulator n=1 Tax=Polyangium sorediatum TaxID=889274 RepID=A0ABT6NI38_9BACT|nr:hypothetical protein [Polyangium sorediatum]MDI1427974.1 hypothetical protein [Polyangium sorediatum]
MRGEEDAAVREAADVEGGVVPTIFRIAHALCLSPLYLLTFPEDDAWARVAELVRRMPAREVAKVRRELAKRR